MKSFIFAMLFFVCAADCLSAVESNPESEIDHLAIASIMISDGRYEKAEEVLSQVDPSNKKIDPSDYYIIRGVLYSKMDRNESAIENYLLGIEATKKKVFLPPKTTKKQQYLFSIGKRESGQEPVDDFDPEKVKKNKLEKLHLYLSQAYYNIEDYANTVHHLDHAGERGIDRPALFSLRAECYWNLTKFDEAIHSINKGLHRFPEEATLLRQKYFYFAELGMYRSAIDVAHRYMRVTHAGPKEYIILAQLLFEAKQFDEAAEVLEKAKGLFSENAKIRILLGHIYMQKEMAYTSAGFFKDAAYKDKQYLKDAVEMHRRIKDFPHAIFLNTQMPDKAEKLKQKMAISLERAEYEKVIGLKDDLDRYSILEDDNMRYALAYSYFMAKDYPNAEKHLKMIQDDRVFVKGTAILKSIEKCRENSMECY